MRAIKARTNGARDVMYRRARTRVSHLVSLSLKLQLIIESREGVW
jgi:hypothetical protein